MKTTGHRPAILVCLTLLAAVWAGAYAEAGPAACAQGSAPPGDSISAEADKKQILELIGRMQDAWNRGDFRGYMQGFKNPDVVFVSGGRFQDGWQGTLDHYIRDYTASRGNLRFYDVRVEILSREAAQLVSRFELVRPEHPQYGINTRLMRKVNGRWVIALSHVSASETPPSASADSAATR